MAAIAIALSIVAAGCASAIAEPTDELSLRASPVEAQESPSTTVPSADPVLRPDAIPEWIPFSDVAAAAVTPEPTCVAPEAETEAPAALVAALEAAAAAPQFESLDLSVSIWVDGWGEVFEVNPDLRLEPASNQKILVAYAAHTLFDAEHRFETSIEHRAGGTGGDLILRAGGDPSLSLAHLESMLSEAAPAIAGANRLVIDVSDYPQDPRASEWLDWQIPRFVGPLSGLMIDDNRWSTSDELVTDPASANGELVAQVARRLGISIDEVVAVDASTLDAASSTGDVVAVHESPTVDQLVNTLLLSSDNQHADLMVLSLGRETTGAGSLVDGIEAMDLALAELCGPLSGVSDDGSGLSRGNERSAGEFQMLLREMRSTEAGQRVAEQLPVGGVSGTLTSRFGGADAGRVQAKTGTIIGGRALSGYATTDSGREAVFSIIVNGEPGAAHSSLSAIDDLVRALLRS